MSSTRFHWVRPAVRARRAAALGSLVLLTACAAPQRRSPTPDPAAELTGAAHALWAARAAEDWAAVYAHTDESTRAAGSAAEFAAWSAANEPFSIADYVVQGVAVAGAFGWVEVRQCVRLRKFAAAPERELTVWEKWRRTDDGWRPTPQRARAAQPEAPPLRDPLEEQRLSAQFSTAWRLRQDRDWRGLYDCLAPTERAALDFDDFVADCASVEYRACECVWVEVIGSRGRVCATYEVKSNDPSLTKLPARSITAIEEWVKDDEQWRRVLQNRS